MIPLRIIPIGSADLRSNEEEALDLLKTVMILEVYAGVNNTVAAGIPI